MARFVFRTVETFYKVVIDVEGSASSFKDVMKQEDFKATLSILKRGVFDVNQPGEVVAEVKDLGIFHRLWCGRGLMTRDEILSLLGL